MPEQAFLAKNYDENAKKPDRDPRAAFRNSSEMAGTAAAGLVGPLGSSSFNLPNVERALMEMEVGISGSPTGAGDAARRANRTSGRPLTAAGLTAVGTSAPSTATGRGQTSPSLSVATPSPTGGQTQHEVLQNFFQSLLSSKDRAGAGNSSKPTTQPKANGSGSAEEGS